MNTITNASTVKTIGLMGQPNTGKSTVFNALTGSRQHVGNWAGKTVERKEGFFTVGNVPYKLIDLPGTYSLLANSDEEVITRDAVMDDSIDVVLAVLDASQLTRSMYLLSDYAGIKKPVIVLLNMIDVAAGQGKSVDTDKISELLGVPVLPVTAVQKDGLVPLADSFAAGKITGRQIRTDGLELLYRENFGENWDAIKKLLPEIQGRSRLWTAAKLMEGDQEITATVSETASGNWAEIESLCAAQKDGLLTASDCKFRWISNIVEQTVKSETNTQPIRSRFDKLATSPFGGKILAFGVILGGLIASMIIATPIMITLESVPMPLAVAVASALASINTSPFLISLLCDALFPAVMMAFLMASYVFGISLSFGFIEEVGYMARISFVFDNTMQRLGLHGKAIMPFIVSFGCNIGGVAGTRVIDSWKQRLLAISTSWVVPCAGVWSVVALMSSTFFGSGAVIVVLALFATALLHIFITAKIFGQSLLSEGDKTGLIMELPPYHKPDIRILLRFVWQRMADVLFRASKMILFVAAVFWLLSYTPEGDVTRSVIYHVGKFIEPVTLWFGMSWQLFIAFVVSGLGKEASLGVISALFGAGGNANLAGIGMATATYTNTNLSAAMLESISKPQALAFIFAFFFNTPCIMAMGATASETHSVKWTLRIAFYYVAMALAISFITYHVGRLIF
jgi:ferrous iron transport protein B